jgi:hypothetical protein
MWGLVFYLRGCSRRSGLVVSSAGSKGNFVHLHVHTEYSMLDGAARLDDLFEEASKQGMPALATTDHGNVFGAYDFYSKANKHGIKPIIGTEAYLTRCYRWIAAKAARENGISRGRPRSEGWDGRLPHNFFNPLDQWLDDDIHFQLDDRGVIGEIRFQSRSEDDRRPRQKSQAAAKGECVLPSSVGIIGSQIPFVHKDDACPPLRENQAGDFCVLLGDAFDGERDVKLSDLEMDFSPR